MDVFETRTRNLALLLKQLAARGITKNKDAAQALGGLGASYLSQLKGGKKMGEDTARKIEVAVYRPVGWIDQPQWPQAMQEVRDLPLVDHEDAISRLIELLPAPERSLLKNYRAASESGKAILEAAAVAAGKPIRRPSATQ